LPEGNYYLQSIDNADETMIIEQKYDGDNNNMVNGRLRALPSLPVSENMSSSDYDVHGYELFYISSKILKNLLNFSFQNTNSEPFNDREISNFNVHPLFDDYLGDEYYDSSLYSSNQHSSTTPKVSKTLPINLVSTSYQQQKATTPSIMTVAGVGLSSFLNSLSNTLQSTAVTVTQPNVTTSYSSPFLTNSSNTSEVYQSNFNYSYSSYAPITSSYVFSSAYTPVSTGSIFPIKSNFSSTSLIPSELTSSIENPIFSSNFQVKSSSSIITSSHTPIPSTIFTSSHTPIPSTIFSSAFSSSNTTSTNCYIESIDKIMTQTSSSNFNHSNGQNAAPITTTSEKLKSFDSNIEFDSIHSLPNLLNYEANYASDVCKTQTHHDPVAPSSSFFGALTSLFDVGSVVSTTSYSATSSSSSYIPVSCNVTSSYCNDFSTSMYNTIPTSNFMSNLSLGHSPIPEEDLENEAMIEDTQLKAIDDKILDEANHYNALPYVASNEYVTSSIPDLYYKTLSIYDSVADEKIEEEYREDFEDGVEPVSLITSDLSYSYLSTTASAISPPSTVTVSSDYFYENSSYPMTTKLSTIPETANDTYLSNTDLQGETGNFEEQLMTPGAYDYTDNENDYIASGDLKNTNLISNYNSQSSSLQTTNQASTNAIHQPETKKSRFGFGSFLSDGLNAIGSSVNTIKSTATNLVGAAAAAATAQSAQSSSNQSASHDIINEQNVDHNSSFVTSVNGQISSKLTKQASEMFEDQHENYIDHYGAKQEHQTQEQVIKFKFINVIGNLIGVSI
jgi:hypothetical protein